MKPDIPRMFCIPEVEMKYYIDQLLLQVPSSLIQYKTGVVKECFPATPTDSPFLDVDAKKKFHTNVAKLLCLAKLAHPDLLTVRSFLCTRVKMPIKRDQKSY